MTPQLRVPAPTLPRAPYGAIVAGRLNVMRVAALLAGASIWFQVEPYPDDEYIVWVKLTEANRLDRYIDDPDGVLKDSGDRL